MTATVNATKAYDLSGGALREDLEDIIYDISPMDTVFLSSIAGRGRCQSTTHEWLIDSLTSAAHNAQIEGDAFSAHVRTLPTRYKNYTQISRVDFEVTGTSQATNNAGMREILAYHTARAGKELKRHMETSLLTVNAASAGTSTSPRVSGAVQNWIYSPNHVSLSSQTTATTTAPVSGFATGTVGAGSSTAITETGLKDALKKAWSAGGETDTILTTAAIYDKIGQFTGLATRFRDVSSKSQAQIIGAADVYVSAYGSHNIRLSRYVTAGSVLCLQHDGWEVAYLRPFQTIDVAKVGDSERRMILAEWTLVARKPRANTKLTSMA